MTPCDLTNFSWIFWIFSFSIQRGRDNRAPSSNSSRSRPPFRRSRSRSRDRGMTARGSRPRGADSSSDKNRPPSQKRARAGSPKDRYTSVFVKLSIHESNFLTPRDLGVGFKKKEFRQINRQLKKEKCRFWGSDSHHNIFRERNYPYLLNFPFLFFIISIRFFYLSQFSCSFLD